MPLGWRRSGQIAGDKRPCGDRAPHHCEQAQQDSCFDFRQSIFPWWLLGRIRRSWEDVGLDEFVVAGPTLAYLLRAMKIKRLPAGFVIPAQPVLASKPPSGADWVHEIKHDGHRMIVHRNGPHSATLQS
jgi:hypothetical protein